MRRGTDERLGIVQSEYSNFDPALRLLSHLVKIYDHLSTSTPASSDSLSSPNISSVIPSVDWSTKRDEAISTWTRLEAEQTQSSLTSEADWKEMESFMGGMKDVEGAVFATIGLL